MVKTLKGQKGHGPRIRPDERGVRGRRWTLGTCVAIVAVAALAGPVHSQDYTFSERNIRKMQKIVEAMEQGDAEEAKSVLQSINLDRAKPYERARVNQMLGAIAVQDGEYEKALEYLQAAVSEQAMQPVENLRTLYQVGQLQTMLERFDEAVATLESWISQVEAPTPSAFYTLAVAYYQAGRAEDALDPARQAVERSDDPREAWYRLLLSLHLQREEYQESLALLDDIILKYPSKTYWTQMASIYSTLGEMSRSLAVQQLAEMEGYIKEGRDLIRLAQMFMVEGLPQRGANVMREGLESGRIEPSLLAYDTYTNTLLQSREWAKAVEPLSQAAELAEDGQLYMKLAQVNLQLGRWSDARRALDQAFEKGDLPDEGQGWILYGIAAANDKAWSTAINAFNNAQRYDGTSEVAGKWLAFVQREKARLGEG